MTVLIAAAILPWYIVGILILVGFVRFRNYVEGGVASLMYLLMFGGSFMALPHSIVYMVVVGILLVFALFGVEPILFQSNAERI